MDIGEADAFALGDFGGDVAKLGEGFVVDLVGVGVCRAEGLGIDHARGADDDEADAGFLEGFDDGLRAVAIKLGLGVGEGGVTAVVHAVEGGGDGDGEAQDIGHAAEESADDFAAPAKLHGAEVGLVGWHMRR